MPDCLTLNLGTEAETFAIPDRISTCFLCAAITSIDLCRKDLAQTRSVNVQQTIALSERLSQKGIRIIFPSSNLVFDGKKPAPHAGEKQSPQTEYGRQKVQVENTLLNIQGPHHAIIRFSKILGPANGLLLNWLESLEHGRPIHPFSDLCFAPIDVRTAIQIMHAVAQRNDGGIWQCSARTDVSYAEFARLLASQAGFSPDLVQPITSAESGIRFEHLPSHTTLDSSRVEEELHIEIPSIEETISRFLQSWSPAK